MGVHVRVMWPQETADGSYPVLICGARQTKLMMTCWAITRKSMTPYTLTSQILLHARMDISTVGDVLSYSFRGKTTERQRFRSILDARLRGKRCNQEVRINILQRKYCT